MYECVRSGVVMSEDSLSQSKQAKQQPSAF